MTRGEVPAAPHLRRRIQEIQEIATLPHVMQRILRVIEDDRSGAQDLAREIAADASLTAKILKIVNSAFYGHFRDVTLVSQAVVVLGFDEIKRISLAISVLNMFEGDVANRASRMRFWLHCLYTASMAELIARRLDLGSQGAFTAGLLHDFGRVVLDQYFPETYGLIVENQRATSRPSADVETDLLGVTHAEIGFWLTERWNFPLSLTEAIRYHHDPDRARESPELTAMVHVADILVHDMTGRVYVGEVRPAMDPHALLALDLRPGDLEHFRNRFAESTQAPEALLQELLAA